MEEQLANSFRALGKKAHDFIDDLIGFHKIGFDNVLRGPLINGISFLHSFANRFQRIDRINQGPAFQVSGAF